MFLRLHAHLFFLSTALVLAFTTIQRSIAKNTTKDNFSPEKVIVLTPEELLTIAEQGTEPSLLLSENAKRLLTHFSGSPLLETHQHLKECCKKIEQGKNVIEFSLFLKSLDELTACILATQEYKEELTQQFKTLVASIRKSTLSLKNSARNKANSGQEIYLVADKSDDRTLYNIGPNLDTVFVGNVEISKTLKVNGPTNLSNSLNVATITLPSAYNKDVGPSAKSLLVDNFGNIGTSSNTSNTGLGYNALNTLSTGRNNTSVGAHSLRANRTGNFNTALGMYALKENTADANTGIGYNTLSSNTNGTQNVALGVQSLASNTTGSRNTAIGNDALSSNESADANTAVGESALKRNASGSENVALGCLSLLSNISGNSNTALGSNALSRNREGSNNVGVGCGALVSNSASDNTAVGFNALGANSFGTLNTALGINSLMSNSLGNNNIAIGNSALAGNIEGNFNIALGDNALQNTVTGTNNIAIGQNAGALLTTGSNNIIIGTDANTPEESNCIRIGTPNLHTSFFAQGIYGQTLAATAVPIYIDNTTSQLGTIVSSRKYKENITAIDNESALLMKLRPVTFTYKSDATQRKQYGLIAEEVQKIIPELTVTTKDGQAETVLYHYLVPLLLSEYQKQQKTIAALAQELEEIKKKS